MDKILEKIATEKLGFSLVPRDIDDLDFHEVGVWILYDALRAAYEAGKNFT